MNRSVPDGGRNARAQQRGRLKSQTTFLLGSRELAGLDPDVDIDIDIYSPTSPLGAAITGRYVGDTLSYPAPAGEQEVTVAAAGPFD